jgi:RNA polymerase sigma factor (sigma-70 family)
MPDANDMDLVQDFARRDSEAALAELVRRHINLVYSVALRCTGRPEDAQDVTQAVFIILAKKAAGLRERTVLTCWLYETTRFTAGRLLRTQSRRAAREQEAYMQSILNESGRDDAWRQLSPHLEEAMSRLSAGDRTLLALRFYENKTGAEAASLLGIREEAAHKRTGRAVEKLRMFFSKRGIALSAVAIAGAVSANSVQVVPMGLAATIAVTAAKGSAVTASTLTLVKGALKVMAWTKAKTAIVVAAGVLLTVGTVSVVRILIAHSSEPLSHQAVESPLASLIVPGVSVGKIRAGMAMAQIIDVLGTPDRTIGNTLTYERYGFHVNCYSDSDGAKAGLVQFVMCVDPSGIDATSFKKFMGRTTEGISMGSSRADVIKAYGEPTTATKLKENDEGLKYSRPLGLDFELSDGKVSKIVALF